jgi:hypothetical protein
MHQSLFAGRRLRGSYRNVSSDFIVALLNETDEQYDAFTDFCLHRPRLRSHHMKEEE